MRLRNNVPEIVTLKCKHLITSVSLSDTKTLVFLSFSKQSLKHLANKSYNICTSRIRYRYIIYQIWCHHCTKDSSDVFSNNWYLRATAILRTVRLRTISGMYTLLNYDITKPKAAEIISHMKKRWYFVCLALNTFLVLYSSM